MNNSGTFFSTLGLAMRAGQVVVGEPKARELAASGEAVLLLLDAAASDAAQKTVRDKCTFYGVPLCMATAGRIGTAIGRPGCICAGIRRGGLGDQLLKKVVENEFEDVTKVL